MTYKNMLLRLTADIFAVHFKISTVFDFLRYTFVGMTEI